MLTQLPDKLPELLSNFLSPEDLVFLVAFSLLLRTFVGAAKIGLIRFPDVPHVKHNYEIAKIWAQYSPYGFLGMIILVKLIALALREILWLWLQ